MTMLETHIINGGEYQNGKHAEYTTIDVAAMKEEYIALGAVDLLRNIREGVVFPHDYEYSVWFIGTCDDLLHTMDPLEEEEEEDDDGEEEEEDEENWRRKFACTASQIFWPFSRKSEANTGGFFLKGNKTAALFAYFKLEKKKKTPSPLIDAASQALCVCVDIFPPPKPALPLPLTVVIRAAHPLR